jgi:hypothetical protein
MTLEIPTRRGFITGLISLVAAPAIVRASSLMPVKLMEPEVIMRFTSYGGGFSVMCEEQYHDLRGGAAAGFLT